jgi:hypothetical protein
VMLSHYVTHREPDVFPNPLLFRPDRWFGAAVDSHAYLPFSAGPRTCIGKALGTVTIQLMVAMILQRFRLSVVPGARIDRTLYVTLAPKYGMPMRVDIQDGRFEAACVRGNVHEMVDLPDSGARTRRATIGVPPVRYSPECLPAAA